MEYGYIKWCTEVGVSAEMLSRDSRKRFRILLNWLGKNQRLERAQSKLGGKFGVKSGESLLLKLLENNIKLEKNLQDYPLSREQKLGRVMWKKH